MSSRPAPPLSFRAILIMAACVFLFTFIIGMALTTFAAPIHLRRLAENPHHPWYTVTIAAAILMAVAVPSANPFQVIVADVKAFVAKVQAGLQWFGAELAAVVAWVDKEIPGAQQTIAALFQELDQGAQALAPLAEQGLQDVIGGAVDEAGTTVANLLEKSGLDMTFKSALMAGDVQAIATAKAIAHGAVDVAMAKLLHAGANVFAASQAQNAADASPTPPAP